MRKPKHQEVEETIAQLLRRPYTKVIRGEPNEGYLAFVPELPGCVTAGETEEDALEMLKDAMGGWFETALERALPIPEPSEDVISPRIPVIE